MATESEILAGPHKFVNGEPVALTADEIAAHEASTAWQQERVAKKNELVTYRRDRAGAYTDALEHPNEAEYRRLYPLELDPLTRQIRVLGDVLDRSIKIIIKLQAAILAIDPNAEVNQVEFDAMVATIDQIKAQHPKT